MIFGIGCDIVQVDRMRIILSKHGRRILEKIFNKNEIADSNKRSDKEVFLSGRWAAKEATSKALLCGIGTQCAWKDITVTNNSDGAPSLKLKGSALRRAKKNAITKINLSISHEKDYAVAFVIMEKKNKML